MGMSRAQIVDKEKRWSWLIGGGLMHGKWKDYKVEKSRRHSR
jgi:hypothetical protein